MLPKQSPTSASRPEDVSRGHRSGEEQLELASVELLCELFGSTAHRTDDGPFPISACIHFEDSSVGMELRGSLSRSRAESVMHVSRLRVDESAEGLLALMSRPGIRAVSLIERMTPAMDLAAQICTVPHFKTVTGLTGKGVLIGIVDSGIDPSHPMFAGRIAAFWDQTVPGTGAGAVPYGELYTGAAILNGGSDVTGHGTHVAGIAAGADGSYGGIAEGAMLVVVKSTLEDTDVEAALRWLKDFALESKWPMVVNLSFEGRADPHDGSGSVCETIDEVSGEGFVVCCASGNSGGEASHAEVVLRVGETANIHFRVSDAGRSRVTIKAWANPDAVLQVAVTDPSRMNWSPQIAAGPQPVIVSHAMHGADLDLAGPKPEPAFGGAVAFLLSLRARAGMKADGEWIVHLTNPGSRDEEVHLWSTPEPDISFSDGFVTDRVKIAAPGAAQSAITVGAFVTRIGWLDHTSALRIDPRSRRFQPALFSAPGPLRSSNAKPDLVAPGAQICSARASAAAVPKGYATSGLHRVMAGTSMATPFVAGIVALMLEESHNLAPAQVKQHLRRICSIPGASSGSFDNRWGYGLPDLALLF